MERYKVWSSTINVCKPPLAAHSELVEEGMKEDEMQTVKARLISRGAGKKSAISGRAQVVVVGLASDFGFPGPKRVISITRHIESKGIGWVGNNPDYRASGLNDNAEQRLANAISELGQLQRKLGQFEKDLEDIVKKKPAEFESAIAKVAMKDKIRELIANAKDDLALAEIEKPAAEKHLEEIQNEFPRLVRFVF